MKGLASSFLDDKTGRQSHSPCHVFALLSDLQFSLLHCIVIYVVIQMHVFVSLYCFISHLILFVYVLFSYCIHHGKRLSLFQYGSCFLLSTHCCRFVWHILFHIPYTPTEPVNYPSRHSSLLSVVLLLSISLSLLTSIPTSLSSSSWNRAYSKYRDYFLHPAYPSFPPQRRTYRVV